MEVGQLPLVLVRLDEPSREIIKEVRDGCLYNPKRPQHVISSFFCIEIPNFCDVIFGRESYQFWVKKPVYNAKKLQRIISFDESSFFIK